jgi:hypothetical protein
MTELIVGFRNFANAPKNESIIKVQFVPSRKRNVLQSERRISQCSKAKEPPFIAKKKVRNT